MKKEMQHHRRGEQIDAHFSVEKDENQPNNHQQIDKENKDEIKSGNIEVVLLNIFVGINPDSHQGKEQQSSK